MIPKSLKSYQAPTRARMLEMLVQAVPYLLYDGCSKGTKENPVEDHHALIELQERFNCDLAEAKLLLRMSIKEFPHFHVYETGVL